MTPIDVNGLKGLMYMHAPDNDWRCMGSKELMLWGFNDQIFVVSYLKPHPYGISLSTNGMGPRPTI